MFSIIAILSWALLSQGPDTLTAGRVTSIRDAARRASVPVQEIGAEELRRSGIIELDEALKVWSSVNIRDYGSLGGLKTVSVRGLGAEHTIVSCDGVLVCDEAGGAVDISRFTLNGVNSMSLTLGNEDLLSPARSALAAGLIAIESGRGTFRNGPVEVGLTLGAGSFGRSDIAFGLNGRLSDNWDTGLNLCYSHSEGDYPFSVKNASGLYSDIRRGGDASRFNGRFSLNGRLRNGGSLALHSSLHLADRGLPGAVILYTQNGRERLQDRIFSSDISFRREFGEGWTLRSNATVSLNGNTYHNDDPAYPEAITDRYMQREGSLSASVARSWRHLAISLSEDLYINDLTSNIPYCPFPVRLSSYGAFRAACTFDRLRLTAIIQRTGIYEWVRSGYAAEPRRRISPSLSLAWDISESLTLRAFCRDGFRSPSFNDLYYARVGNRSLQSEKALQTGLGAGFRHNARNFTLLVNTDMYWNEVRDKIVAIPTMWVWKMRNLGRVRMLGADNKLRADYRIGSVHLRGEANLSLLYAVDISERGAKNYGHQIQYTPLLSGGSSALVEWKGYGAEYRLQACGERFFLPQNIAANRMEPFFDHNVSIYKNFKFRSLELSVRMSALNLADINYEIIHGYPMPGRNYRLSISIRYI